MDKLWWTTVPNSVRFIDDIVAAFTEGSSVVCVISEKCEWVETLRNIIKDKILSGINKTHEITGKNIGVRLPGEYLIEEFVKAEIRAQFRTSVGYEDFLTRIEANTSLIHSYIYVRDLSEKQTHEWLDFIYKYNKLHKPDSQRCKFIIESKVNVFEERKGIRVFRRNDYLHNYDITILCMMAASSKSLNNAFREYSAELATLCAQKDPELASELIMLGEELLKDIEGTVERLISDSLRSNYEPYQPVRNLDRIIWKAQLKVFFPLIERYRLFLIERYKVNIPIHKCITNMKGEEIESVYEIELNTIKWLYDNDELYLTSDDFEELKFFKECRNSLAHLKTLSFDRLKKIVDTIEKI